jgi:hypothetical protein
MKEVGSQGTYKKESFEFIFTQQLYADTCNVQSVQTVRNVKNLT